MPKRRSAKDNLYKNGVDTLSAHMTLSPKKSESNIDILRKILSIDTIIEDINQEYALEFLEAVEGDIATEREEIEELKHDYDEIMKKTDFDLQIGSIEYRSSGIMDNMIMDALAEAYDWLTPLEIMDRLKITTLKKAV
jgi:hypothetical protein